MSIARMIVKATMFEKKERFENELVKLELMLKDFKINKNGGE